MIYESNENINEILENKEMYMYSNYEYYQVILYEYSILIINFSTYKTTNIYNKNEENNMLFKILEFCFSENIIFLNLWS